MQITSSFYRTQSLTSLLADTRGASSSKGGLTPAEKPPSASSAGLSFSQGYTSFKQSLSSSNLDNSTSATLKNAEGMTLAEAGAKGAVNPADWLSQSDTDLYSKVTGGSIRDGVAYDKDGNIDTSERNQNLVDSLFMIRNFGTFDGQGNMVGVNGSITANDLQGYINHYSHGGWFSSDMSVLDDAMKALTSSQA